MRYRRTATLVVLIAAVSGMSYFAFGAYVRSTTGKSLRRAALHVQRDKPVDARDALKWLLWFEPHHPAALHLTGLSYVRQQNLPAAIEHLERIGEDSELHEDAQIDLATALLGDRQFQRAESVLSRHLLRYPNSLIARRLLSGLLLTELRQREAVGILEEYLRLSASEPLALSDRLLILRDLSTAEFHPPLAATCQPTLQEARGRHPDQLFVQLALGQCYWDVGNTNEAESLLRDAFRQRPRDLRIRFIFCEFLIENGDPDTAEAVLLRDSESSSNSVGNDGSALEQDDRSWELQCRIAERRGEYERALKDIDRAVSIQPSDKEYESRRARLLQRVGRADDARRAYARSHELASSELDLWNLSRELGVRVPTTAECERVASLYESLGKTLQAGAWRRLAKQIEREVPPRTGSAL